MSIFCRFRKQEAKAIGIRFDRDSSDDVIHHQIWKQLEDIATPEATQIINTVKSRRETILDYAMSNPKELAMWLYENQGEMRFGAENRLFLVLIDNENWNASWEMKRNINLLQLRLKNIWIPFPARI